MSVLLIPLSFLVWGFPLFDIFAFRPAPFRKSPRVTLILFGFFGICWAVAAASLISDFHGTTLDQASAGLLLADWIGAALPLSAILGISLRDDVLERNNRAALWPILGAMIALAASFAGAQVGTAHGPATLIAAAFTMLALANLWILADRVGDHWLDAITIDRDQGASLRFAGLMAASGLSIGSTAQSGSLFSAWTLLPVYLLAIVIERSLRKTRESARSTLFATMYLLITIAAIALERYIR